MSGTFRPKPYVAAAGLRLCAAVDPPVAPTRRAYKTMIPLKVSVSASFAAANEKRKYAGMGWYLTHTLISRAINTNA